MQIFRRTTELNPLADVNIPVQVLRRQISDAVAAEVNLHVCCVDKRNEMLTDQRNIVTVVCHRPQMFVSQ